MAQGFLVIETLENAHPRKPDYPLLKDDLLYEHAEEPGVFTKVCPGLAIVGFELTAEQQTRHLKAVEYEGRGLDFRVLDSASAAL